MNIICSSVRPWHQVIGFVLAIIALANPAAGQTNPVQTDLALWLDATVGVTTNVSDEVTLWEDQSGNNHHATPLAGQPGGSPVLSQDPSLLNDQPHVQLHDDGMILAGTVQTSQDFTLIGVYDTNDQNNSPRILYSNFTPATAAGSVYLGAMHDGSQAPVQSYVRFTDHLNPTPPSATSLESPRDHSIVRVSWDHDPNGTGSSSVHQIAGATLNKLNHGSASAPLRDFSTTSYLGVQGSNLNEWWQGDLAELLIYDKLLTTTETAAVENYLSVKWFGREEGVWLADDSGNWDDNKWNVPHGPDSAESVAKFRGAIQAPRTVFTEQDRTLHGVEFDNNNEYVIAGNGGINLVQNGIGNDPSIIVKQGSHQFQNKVNLMSDTDVIISQDASVWFNNLLDLGGNTLDIFPEIGGGNGHALFNTAITGSGTINATGALAVGVASASIGDANLNSTNKLAFLVYPASSASLVTTGTVTLEGAIQIDLLDGATVSAPMTLIDSTIPIVFPGGDVSSLTLAGGGLAGFELSVSGDGTDLLLTSTTGTPGDFDGDGDVDGIDLLEWQVGNSPNPLSQSDLMDWENNYGTAGLAAATAAVPEPTSAALLLAGAMAGLRVRRRR